MGWHWVSRGDIQIRRIYTDVLLPLRFPMGSVAVILLFGWLYELFEIKWLMIGSVVLFEVGSAICASAPTMNAMIVGRVVAGAGGSGMYLG